VVLEGLDGAGSTTQLNLLAASLREQGRAVELTKEPTNGPFGATSRQAIEGRVEVDPVAMALCFAADRRDHVTNGYNGIERMLAAGSWVLCDRYVVSSLAYQSAEQVPLEWLLEINRFVPPPDLTVYIDTPPDTCWERVAARSSNVERFHDLAALKEVAAAYEDVLSRPAVVGHLIRVGGDQPPDVVAAEVLEQVVAWESSR
jgi:dTMP kinase